MDLELCKKIFAEKTGMISGGGDCNKGYAIVEISNIPADCETHNKQLLCCLNNSANTNMISIFHRILYRKDSWYPPPPGYENCAPDEGWPAWRLESGDDQYVAEWNIQKAHFMPGNKRLFGFFWNGKKVMAMDLTDDTWKSLPMEKWSLQELTLDRPIKISHLETGCRRDKWGWRSPAGANLLKFQCMDYNPKQFVAIVGNYWQMCDQVHSPTKTINNLQNNLREIQNRLPCTIGTRNWIIDGRMENIHPWVKRQGKFDLAIFDPKYFQRIRAWADTHLGMGAVCIFDLFDNYRMVAKDENGNPFWDNHPLNPANNWQGSYGLETYPGIFYKLDTGKNPSAWQVFVKNYVQTIVRTVGPNSYVVYSSGNEMVAGNEKDRIGFHRKIGEWIKEINRDAMYTINDKNECMEAWKIPTVGLISTHSMGGVQCANNEDFTGNINWSYWNSFGKAVLLDNDGTFQCRNRKNRQIWAKLAFEKSRIHGSKMDWPGEPDWENSKIYLQDMKLIIENLEV